MLNTVNHERKGASRKRLLVLVLRPFRVFSWGLSCPPARSRLQLTDLAFQFRNLLLLLFDRIKHSPEDWIAVDHQVALAVLSDGFRNDLLHCLSSEADVFSLRLKAE